MSGRIDSLVLKIAERCNLNCSYCYMYQHEDKSYLGRPRFISDEVFDQLLVRICEYCDKRAPHRMSLSLHGGEPTLIGADRLDRLGSRARHVLGERLADISMQTNATLVDDRLIDVLRRHQILVGVSLDGPADIHDTFRVDHAGRGSHAATVRGLRLLNEAGLLHGVLCVINPGASGVDIYRYFRCLGIKRINFLLPEVTHDSKNRLYGHFGETPVADYLIPIFEEWFAEDDPGVKIRVFWELLGLMMGGPGDSDAFGNPLMNYLVIETDGTIQACDALRVCEEGIASSGLTLFAHGFDDLHLGLPLVHRVVHEGMPLSAKCQLCPEKAICGGGYLPHRYARANGFDNPSAWCSDILKLLAHMRAKTSYVFSS
jgi:uncharacterized protein